MSSEFYVYVLIDPRDDQPFYVGKGKGNRLYHHLKESQLKKKSHKNNKIIQIHASGYGVTIKKVKENLTEKEAIDLERQLIAKYGRRDNQTGILTNNTDGGEGVSGYVYSDKQKQERSKRAKGKNNPNYGKKHTAEVKQKLSDIQKGENNNFYGKKHTKEWKEKMSSMQEKHKFIQLTAEGELIRVWDSICEFEKETGVSRAQVYQSLRTPSCSIKGNYLRDIDYPLENEKVKNIDRFKKENDSRAVKKTLQLTLDREIIRIWDSRKEVCEYLGGVDQSSLSRAIRTGNPYKGYIWVNA